MIYTGAVPNPRKRGSMASTEAQKRAAMKWTKNNTVSITLRFNKESEADLIEWVESQPNKSKAVKDLIRKAM